MSSNTKTARDTLATIEQWLDEVGVKAAEANTEAGSIGGPTTHPIKSVKDNTEAPNEGARSKENSKDVKEDQGKPSVDATPEAKAKKGEDTASGDQVQIGTKKAPTGEDPAAETESTKPGKEDPGSSHPARTDNNELNGGKYAFDLDTAPLEKLAEAMKELGNGICADLVTDQEKAACNDGKGDGSMHPAATGDRVPPAKEAPQGMPEKKSNAIDPKLAEQYGWGVAAMLSGNFDKKAADATVQEALAEIVKVAEDDADNVITYLQKYYKQADGGTPPMGGSGGPGEDPLTAAMAGGGAGPAGAAGAMGAGPGAGGPPGAAAGGPPGAGGAGGPGGEQISPEELMQLLQSMGVTPEELEQVLAEEQGGGAGGPPGAGGAGGPPHEGGHHAHHGDGGPSAGPAPMGGAPGQPPMEVAAAEKQAAAKQEEIKKAAISYVREVVGRSRTKRAAAAAA